MRAKRGSGRLATALAVALLAVACALGVAWFLARPETPAGQGATYGEYVGEGGGIDWESLKATNPDVVAWVTVDGTPIDYPVLQSSGDEASDFYLTHGLDGTYSSQGSAFLDVRAQADSGARLVFAHHMGGTGLMFSSVAKAYSQDVFDALGEMSWSTPDGGTKALSPVMAMSVDESYQPIQRFGFVGASDMVDWLSSLLGDAGAVADDAEHAISQATDVVTLCTCSSDRSGQRARTLVVFVG